MDNRNILFPVIDSNGYDYYKRLDKQNEVIYECNVDINMSEEEISEVFNTLSWYVTYQVYILF